MSLVTVKNINRKNLDAPKCGCSDWITHWKKNSKHQLKEECYACGKMVPKSKLVGGHVIIEGATDNTWYILPICHSCNAKKNGVFEVEKDFLIPVSKCDKNASIWDRYIKE